MATTYKFVSTAGSGTTGSKASPMAITTALQDPTNTNIPAGSIVWIRGGTYSNFTYNFSAGSSMLVQTKGTAAAHTVFRAYPGETVIFDFPNNASGPKAAGWRHDACDFVRFQDIIFSASADTEERCTIDGTTNGTGINRRSGPGPGGAACQNVQYVNCEFRDFANGPGFQSTVDKDYLLYGNIVSHNGWLGSDDGHGHGNYHQNSVGNFRMIGNVACFNMGNGIQNYGSNNAMLRNFEIRDNIGYCNGELTAGFTTPTITMTNNGTGYSNNFTATGANGWTAAVVASGGVIQTVTTSNFGTSFSVTPQAISFTAGGGSSAAGTYVSGTYLHNEYLIGQGVGAPAFRDAGLIFTDNKAYRWEIQPRTASFGSQIGYGLGWVNPVIERNYLYGGNHTTFGLVTAASFENILDGTPSCPTMICNDNDFLKAPINGGVPIPVGSPANRTSSSKPGTLKTFVLANRFQRGRGFVTIYNWAAAASPISVDISALGLLDQQTFNVYKTSDMTTILTSGTYSSGAPTFNFPITSTAILRPAGYNGPMPAGTGTEYANYLVKPTSQLETPN